jgi:phosphoribosylamine--glycine ligase
MRVCVVGSGGREHALAVALARSSQVVVTPGNPGMPGERIAVTPAPADEVEADLYVIGPEGPLVAGLADRLRAAGRRVAGPGADGARLEGSKAFMKEVLSAAGVATARHGVFTRADDARRFLRGLPGPWVVKTDGLAAGKGVLVASSLAQAEADVAAKLGGAFGDAGRRLVIEEGLSGPECSLLVLCDGTAVLPLAVAQDFKRAGDADTGPNTGGMGAYAPVPALGPKEADRLVEEAVRPLVRELRRRGIDYRGVLYAGLMLTDDGPRVLEYNVRFGDPEAQVVLPLVEEDLAELLAAVADGRLGAVAPSGRLAAPSRAAVCVVLAAAGYPAAPALGEPVGGLDAAGRLAEPVEGVTALHAGTARERPGGPFTVAGGRVLGITAVAADLDAARRRAYAAASTVGWPGAQRRSDVAAAPLRVVPSRPARAAQGPVHGPGARPRPPAPGRVAGAPR